MTTHQYILQFDITMHQSLAMQKPDAFHHIKGDQQSASVVQPSLDPLVQVPL